MSIRYKILLGFGVLLIIFVSIVCIAYSRLISLKSEYYQLAEEVMPIIGSLEHIKFAGLRIVSSISETGLILDLNENNENELTTEMVGGERDLISRGNKLLIDELQTYLTHIDTHFPENVDQSIAINTAAYVLMKKGDTLLELLYARDSHAEIMESKEDFEGSELNFLNTVETAIEQQRHNIGEKVEAVSGNIQNTINIMLMGSIILLLCIIVISYQLSQIIVNPIIRLRNHAVKIGKGGIIVKEEAVTNDEIGELLLAFSQMADDIHKHRTNLEELVQQRTTGLTAANQELADFAHSVSHDLKAPLRAIEGFSEFLAEDYSAVLDETGRSYLTEISEGAMRMGKMVDDLLAHARLGREDFRYHEVDLNFVLNMVMKNLDRDIKGSNAVIKIENKLPVVSGHQPTLEMLLQNLLSNAIKYIAPDTQPEIIISSREVVGEYQIKIQDNGIGINEKHQQSIFKIFERLHTREDYPGTGIGLAIAAKAVKLHRGRLWFESEVGAGTSFFFSIVRK